MQRAYLHRVSASEVSTSQRPHRHQVRKPAQSRISLRLVQELARCAALYEKAEEGVQAVLRAQAARDRVSSAAEGSGELAAQAKKIVDLATTFESSMVATGTTLVQIISEPTKPLSKLVTLHNVLEHSEGPPNQPWHEVFDKVAGEMDSKIADFDTA